MLESIESIKVRIKQHENYSSFRKDCALYNKARYWGLTRWAALELGGKGSPRKIIHTPESVLLEAKKYKSRSEFNRGNRSAYEFARKHKLLDCTGLPAPYLRSKEDAWKNASQYKSLTHLRKGNRDLYDYAKKNDMLVILEKHYERRLTKQKAVKARRLVND